MKRDVVNEISGVIDVFSERAKAFVRDVESRNTYPELKALKNLQQFNIVLQEDPINPQSVLKELDAIGSPATVLNTGARYFGFVIGGTLPAALGANLLAGVWDQNAGLEPTSPISAHLEMVCRKWLNTLLQLPPETEVGFVTGATMANFTALAAARHSVLLREGWNVEEDGLFAAPPITVVISEEAHVSLFKALSHLGLGKNRVVRVPCDNQGRMRPDLFPKIKGPAIVCIQAGNIHSGAFDPADEICDMAHAFDAWVHVDGAFGLWALAVPEKAHLTRGLEKADSWATDAHKWLNTPYDSGLAFVRDAGALTASMTQNASYLIQDGSRDPFVYVPEMSRKARGIEIWSALRSLGKNGLTEMIRSSCELAGVIAEKLRDSGFQVLNDVVLNQVLVSFGDDDLNKRIIKRIQEEGTCWLGGSSWHNKTIMRISISSWRTTREDIDLCANIIAGIARDEILKSASNLKLQTSNLKP
ncbi:MAG TPA: aminotransferase class V-fold PLP-dependent enzyme [Bacteroidales bacterium]|nr:aminotransferase class V-fold PLP-dependent enzyme [Bacteroidales bacterium]